MLGELDVLKVVTERLESANLAFMLTGSFAMAYYGQPRMTRDLDLVVAMSTDDVDLIVRKSSEYRQLEFSRRKRVTLDSVTTWIVSREDLILSKLVWAREARSDLQLRDVKNVLDETVDRQYLERWARELGVDGALAAVLR